MGRRSQKWVAMEQSRMNQINEQQMVNAIKDYILRDFLPGEPPEALTESTPLITSGILDSIATFKFMSFLEETFSINFEAHEADVEFLNTIHDVILLIKRKRGV
jgi:acyl carrier protein